MNRQLVPVSLPDIPDAGGTSKVVFALPEEVALTQVQFNVGTANVTDTGDPPGDTTLTLKVQTGASGHEVDLCSVDADPTDDAQELAENIPVTTGANLAAGTRITLSATSVGATHAAVTGITVILTVERPLKP